MIVDHLHCGSSITMTSEFSMGPPGLSQKRSALSFDQSINICLSLSFRRTSGGATPCSTLWNFLLVMSNTSGLGRATYPCYWHIRHTCTGTYIDLNLTYNALPHPISDKVEEEHDASMPLSADVSTIALIYCSIRCYFTSTTLRSWIEEAKS